MTTTSTYRDVQLTAEVKTFELTLSCGACNQGTFLPAEGTTPMGESILHTCTHCGRQLIVEGVPYPRLETRRIPAYRDIIENPAPLPDPNAPLPELTDIEIADMLMDKKVELLLSTTSENVINILERQSEPALHRLPRLRDALYELARQAAEERAALLPAGQASGETVPNEVAIADLAIILSTTGSPLVVDRMRQLTEYRLGKLPAVRTALFAIARQEAKRRAEVGILVHS